MRTTSLAGTQVGTIAYCSISSGFSNFTHDTQVGTLLTRHGSENGYSPNDRNISRELINQGTDALRAVIQYAHEHQIEVFWSMRMNDTHDAAHRPEKPYFLFPPLKEEHPDWLVGDHLKRTPFGRWSSVDYAREEVRDLALAFLEEVCRNYDVDGVELDFFRHLCYFQSVANGGVSTKVERDALTGLVRRVRTMTEDVGLKRGRPILMAVRVPDSVGYCRDMGFDIERWLEDGLVDILVTTGYFRLNPWNYTVELAHKHGVQAYPCLSDSRVRGESRFHRGSLEAYRGRAMNAWQAGADGIHLFNFFDPHSPLWREVGDPKTLGTLEKLYFVTVRDGNPDAYLANGSGYRTVPLLTPSFPKTLSASQPMSTSLIVGEDVGENETDDLHASVTLHLEVPLVRAARQLSVKFNGMALSNGELADGWADLPVPVAAVRQGANELVVSFDPEFAAANDWSVVYDGRALPGSPWKPDAGSERTERKLAEDGALLIADRGDVSGDYLFYRCPWGADPSSKTTVEARVKTISGSNYIIVANGEGGERLAMWPDRIELYHHRDLRYEMNTTDRYHDYRIETTGPDLKVFVDGTLRIDAKGKFTARSGYPRSECAFGAANSGMKGEAYWQHVYVRTSNASCRDVVLRVRYQ
jgi:hypothetical protein